MFFILLNNLHLLQFRCAYIEEANRLLLLLFAAKHTVEFIFVLFLNLNVVNFLKIELIDCIFNDFVVIGAQIHQYNPIVPTTDEMSFAYSEFKVF